MISPARPGGKIIPLAAIIAASACVFFIKSGFLVIFFLVPLGFVRFRYNPETSWAAFALASAVNLLLALASIPILRLDARLVVLDQAFFIAVAGIFVWINGPKFLAIPGTWRMVTGSCLAALVFAAVFSKRLGGDVFYEAAKSQIELLKSLYNDASQGAAESAAIDSLTPEFFLETMRAIMLRGGALISAVSILWISRLAGIGLVRLSGGNYTPRRLKNFHADSRIIWGFSFSLILILIMRLINTGPLEILVWNILVLCAVLYLAQGIGILQHLASKPSLPAALRMAVSVVFIILLFSPGINALLVGMVVLLGIAENWAPLRQAHSKPDEAR